MAAAAPAGRRGRRAVLRQRLAPRLLHAVLAHAGGHAGPGEPRLRGGGARGTGPVAAHVMTRRRAHVMTRRRAHVMTRRRAHVMTRRRAHVMTRRHAHVMTRRRRV